MKKIALHLTKKGLVAGYFSKLYYFIWFSFTKIKKGSRASGTPKGFPNTLKKRREYSLLFLLCILVYFNGMLCSLNCIEQNRDEFCVLKYTKMLTISQQRGYNVHIVFNITFSIYIEENEYGMYKFISILHNIKKTEA